MAHVNRRINSYSGRWRFTIHAHRNPMYRVRHTRVCIVSHAQCIGIMTTNTTRASLQNNHLFKISFDIMLAVRYPYWNSVINLHYLLLDCYNCYCTAADNRKMIYFSLPAFCNIHRAHLFPFE